jgi:hypothetical protein
MPKQTFTIIRTVKNRDTPYTMINRAVVNDAQLSWEARGVLAYLLDKPDNWVVCLSDLVRKGPGGAGRMRRILAELEATGYIHRQCLKNAAGRFSWITTVYETPQLAEVTVRPDPGLPSTANPPTANPPTANPPTANPPTANPPTANPPTANLPIYNVLTIPNTDRNDTDKTNTEGEGDALPPPPRESFTVTTERLWPVLLDNELHLLPQALSRAHCADADALGARRGARGGVAGAGAGGRGARIQDDAPGAEAAAYARRQATGGQGGGRRGRNRGVRLAGGGGVAGGDGGTGVIVGVPARGIQGQKRYQT